MTATDPAFDTQALPYCTPNKHHHRYAPAAHGEKHGMLAIGVAGVYTVLPLSVVTCLYVVILREAKECSRRRGDGVKFWRAPLTVSIVVGQGTRQLIHLTDTVPWLHLTNHDQPFAIDE